jgi:hypothetical protein
MCLCMQTQVFKRLSHFSLRKKFCKCCLIQFETWINRQPCITVFTEIKWNRGLSFRRTYIMSLRATLEAGQWSNYWFQLRGVHACDDSQPWLEVGLGIISCVSLIRSSTSSHNFVLNNFPANFFTKIVYVHFVSSIPATYLVSHNLCGTPSDMPIHLRSLTLYTLTN